MPQAPQPSSSNQPQQQQWNDPSILAKINKDELGTYILNLLKNDIRDREGFDWTAMRQYDILSYEGMKPEARDPWYKASNFPVPLTATLLDTGHAHTVQSIWSNPNKVVTVKGVGQEDERTAKPLEMLLNWQVLNDIDDAYEVIDVTVHRAYKHGNAYIKVIHGSGNSLQKPKVIWARVPVENMFLPLTARGSQPSQCSHIFELIPLDENDWEMRKMLKNPDGSPLYDGIADLAKGNSISNSSQIAAMTQVRDIASGTSLGNKYSRDIRYMMECYLTYLWKDPENPDHVFPLELIVWISPQGGKVMNMVLNPDFDQDSGEFIRPYSIKWIPYPRDDRHYGDSLPWRIKHIQEELDYAHNQNLNAAEIAIKPPKFYRAGSGFDPESYETVPDGWYPVANPQQDIFIPTFNVNPIFERQEDKYWELAERLTGFTELFQGSAPDRRQTATMTIARENKSEVRFSTIYRRFAQGFNELMQLTYFYDKQYMPDDVKVKVMGYGNYQTVTELFPEGIGGRYNFFFSSSTTVEQQQHKQDVGQFYTTAMLNPIVASNPANQWRILEMYAESMGIRNLDAVIQKPAQAEILSPDECIRRILAGEYNIVPDPNIDSAYYITKLTSFMRTDMFLRGIPQIRQAVTQLLQRVQAIQAGQNLAMHDAMMMQEVQRAHAQAVASQPPANGAQPALNGATQNGATQ